MMIKESIQEEAITLIKIYVPNIEAPKHIKQILTGIRGKIDSNTITVGDFKIPLTPTDKSSRRNINKEAVALNDTLDHMLLIDIYRTFYPSTADYTFFSSEHGNFSRIDHILSHKTSLNKF